MLNLGRLKNLADGLGLSPDFISGVLDDFDSDPDSLVCELTLWPADSSKKLRDVIALRKRWRLIQKRIYLKLLLPRLKPSRYSHGGVRGRSPATNARVHIGNTFGFVADISGFFPSISCRRVNDFFLGQACSYGVAKILTRLCTYDFHLALGLMTSPIIANEIFRPIDARIAHACRKMDKRLAYSRFIDDITISGNFDSETSGIEEVVRSIINRHGFSLADSKTDCDEFAKNRISITGIRVKRGHLDPSGEYMKELDRLITDHANLSNNEEFIGPLLLRPELYGKVHYACAINPGRRSSLLGRLKEIDWTKLSAHAHERGLVKYRNRLARRGEPRPDCSEPLSVANTSNSHTVVSDLLETGEDPTIAPF